MSRDTLKAARAAVTRTGEPAALLLHLDAGDLGALERIATPTAFAFERAGAELRAAAPDSDAERIAWRAVKETARFASAEVTLAEWAECATVAEALAKLDVAILRARAR